MRCGRWIAGCDYCDDLPGEDQKQVIQNRSSGSCRSDSGLSNNSLKTNTLRRAWGLFITARTVCDGVREMGAALAAAAGEVFVAPEGAFTSGVASTGAVALRFCGGERFAFAVDRTALRSGWTDGRDRRAGDAEG